MGARTAMDGKTVKIPITQSFLAWSRLIPLPVLLGAFGLPMVGLLVRHLTGGEAPVLRQGLLAGAAVVCLVVLARILGHLDQYYYGGDILLLRLCRAGVTVPVTEAVLMAVFWSIIGLWCAYQNGITFMAMWGLLATLFAVNVLLLRGSRLFGSLSAGCIGAAECLVALPFSPRSWGGYACLVAAGFGLVAFLIEWVVLFKPKRKGPLRDVRRREGWYPFVMYLILSSMAFILVWKEDGWLLGKALAAGAVLLGGWEAFRISRALTIKGITQSDRIGVVNYCGIPRACLAGALLLGGNPATAALGAGLALASLAWMLLSRRLPAPFDPNKTSLMLPAYNPGGK